LGSELEKALADCNKALKLRPKAPDILDSRGLVLLRLGKFDRAIADYTASLSVNPSNAWALYGRGLAELRKGMADGQADLVSATSLAPSIAAEFSKLGLAR
jgi:tetratricopeptide (TPR) repeat protein